MQGADVIVTSGFLEATTQLGFQKLLKCSSHQSKGKNKSLCLL